MRNKTLRLILFSTMVSGFSFAQKVGVNTDAPTENLDVNGTVRLRDVPFDGTPSAIHTKSGGTASDTKDQTFTADAIVVINNDGVLGKIEKEKTPPTDLNNAKSMFVIRRYRPGDWPSGGNNQGISTNMASDTWEAFMTVPGFGISRPHSGTPYNNSSYGWFLYDDGTHWRILGDIATFVESPVIDILFIKKGYVTADERQKPSTFPRTP